MAEGAEAQATSKKVHAYNNLIFAVFFHLLPSPSFRMLHTQYASRRVEVDGGGWQSMRLHTQQNLALILIILFFGGVYLLWLHWRRCFLERESIDSSEKIKLREANTLHGSFRESTTEFGNMLEKRFESLGVFIFIIFILSLLCLSLLLHTHLHTSFLVCCFTWYFFQRRSQYLHITVSFRGFICCVSTFIYSS